MIYHPVKVASIVSYEIFPPKMGGQKGIALFYKYFENISPVAIISIKENAGKGFLKSEVIPALGKNKKWRYVNPFLFFKIRSILKKEQITHLILEHPYYGWLGILLKWFTKTKLIIHSHNIEALRFKSTGKWWWTILWNYEKLTHQFADLNFFITEEDMKYAIQHFKIHEKKCEVITYGFEMSKTPDPQRKADSRRQLCIKHDISDDENILLFNGTLDYAPNLDALHVILKKINPRLIASGFKYKIIICGKNLPPSMNGLEEYRSQNIIFAGFVDDIDQYFLAADMFINPVVEGGGIKTKLVEALGHDVSVISTASGAIGIPLSIAGDKLCVIEDGEWELFATSIPKINTKTQLPPDFFNHFYWGHIARTAHSKILNL